MALLTRFAGQEFAKALEFFSVYAALFQDIQYKQISGILKETVYQMADLRAGRFLPLHARAVNVRPTFFRMLDIALTL